jgi:hypothetical protein
LLGSWVAWLLNRQQLNDLATQQPFCYLTVMEIPSKVSVFNKTLEMKGKAGTLIAINDLGFYEIMMEVQQRNHTVLFPIEETVVIFNEAMPTLPADFEVER